MRWRKGCRAFVGGALVEHDVWTLDGLVIDAKKRFYESTGPAGFGQPEVINCGGRIVSPGYIDIQINGAFGVDFADTTIGTKELALVAEVRACAFLPPPRSSSPWLPPRRREPLAAADRSLLLLPPARPIPP